MTHWKRLWCWEGLGAGEGDDRGWDGWMTSLTRWTWVWVNSRSWWWTGRPGVLWFMGSQRVGHDWVTELSWIVLKCFLHARHWYRMNQDWMKLLKFFWEIIRLATRFWHINTHKAFFLGPCLESILDQLKHWSPNKDFWGLPLEILIHSSARDAWESIF